MRQLIDQSFNFAKSRGLGNKGILKINRIDGFNARKSEKSFSRYLERNISKVENICGTTKIINVKK